MKLLLASALLLVSALTWAQNDASPPAPAVENDVASRPAKRELIGRLARDFELPALDGSRPKLSDLRGKAVVLNFWATYCGPCKIYMPWFVELQEEYGSQGLQIVGVDIDDSSTEGIAKFARETGISYPILLGNKSVEKSYDGLPLLPTTFFMDRDGKIIAHGFGLQSRDVFVDHIKKILSQPVQTGERAACNPEAKLR
jgi:thiol-disulfide isomerase/thioredoxin